MAKDKKAKKAEKKARTAEKQERKATKKEKKNKTKGRDDDSDAEDVDIDAVLAEYARQQEQFLKVTEAPSEPPSARGSSTLIASPANDNELFLFGGEYFNGALAKFYNDLYVYNIRNDEWKVVTSPNSPLPRSGHAWTRGGNEKAIYLFGGEFSSPKQGTFYHYNDFWRLDPVSREWSRIEVKGKNASPPARSGHRMTYYKQYIILFGGFQDTSQTTKYLQDIWIYDTQNFVWHAPVTPPASGKPDARSSFSFLPHDRGAVLYGGYSRVKASTGAGKGQSSKGGGGNGGTTRVVLKPMVHQDTWFLRISPPASDASPGTLPKVSWERRKRPANPPNPVRAGATMAYHKGRGVMFGGVHDVEASEEGIESEFFNNLFAWNVERNRFFPLSLRRPRTQTKKTAQTAESGRRGRGKANEEELLRNLAALEMKGKIEGEDDEIEALLRKKEEEEEVDQEKVPKPVIFEFPHPRFNAQLTVQGDVLYIFGGTYEKGDREYTFDELWAIDLGKLDGVKEVYRRDLEDWQGDEEEESEEEEEEDGEEDDSEEDEGSEIASTIATSDGPSTAPTSIVGDSDITQKEDGDDGPEEEKSALTDSFPHPRPFESLRDFYARTSETWQTLVIDSLSKLIGGKDDVAAAQSKSPKEIKKKAFEQAEEKWWDCREEIRALEDEQEAAGIGEVVSIADKAEASSSGFRRR
jgi:N-acetylneuraminic acid mutarotase